MRRRTGKTSASRNLAWAWTPANERKALRTFGVTAYRPGQRALIHAVLHQQDAIGLLPTGGGKSLCFQLPSLFLPRAVLVISPLISLMQDQDEKLRALRIAAVSLNSAVPVAEEARMLQDISAGRPEIIYITPERLERPNPLNLLRSTGVALVVIDEAHCISQWGHDFRPAYLAIREAVEQLGKPPVLALTATATPEVITDISTQLGLTDPLIVNHGINRPNLTFEVYRTVNEEEKLDSLLWAIRSVRNGPGIVYVATVRQATELHARLLREGIAAGRYHGRMAAADRRDTQEAFTRDAYDVIVATKAFGLGIDKANLRFVIHYAFPDSLESYVQEAGRAGRDGRPARAMLLYRLEDRRVQAYFLGGKYPRGEECLRVYQAIACGEHGPADTAPVTLTRLQAVTGLSVRRLRVIVALLVRADVLARDGDHIRCLRAFRDDDELGAYVEEYERRHRRDQERLATMMKYGQTTECRVRFLTRYFSQEIKTDCGRCDNCRKGLTDLTVDIRELHAGEALAGLSSQ